jgi:F-type H+-transporting ATPase subunit b
MKAFIRMGKARYVISLLVVVSVLFAFGSVWASSEGGGEGQLDKGKDLIWRTMNFAVLAVALFFLLRKPIAKALESRRQGIKDSRVRQQRQRSLRRRKLRLKSCKNRRGRILSMNFKRPGKS